MPITSEYIIKNNIFLKNRSKLEKQSMSNLMKKNSMNSKLNYLKNKLNFFNNKKDLEDLTDFDFLTKLFSHDFFLCLDQVSDSWSLKLQFLMKNNFLKKCEKIRIFFLVSFEMRIKILLNCQDDKFLIFLVKHLFMYFFTLNKHKFIFLF